MAQGVHENMEWWVKLIANPSPKNYTWGHLIGNFVNTLKMHWKLELVREKDQSVEAILEQLVFNQYREHTEKTQ